MAKTGSDFDGAWKAILDRYFKEFMAFCFPEKYQHIDWEKGYKTRDKELNKIAREVVVGNRVVDKLIEISLKEGQELLCHVEIQGSKEANFEKRMFIYYLCLGNYYSLPIVSIAILTDQDNEWRPNTYRSNTWGSGVEFHFLMIKLLDYCNRIEMLEASRNPIAVVILAHLGALKRLEPEIKLVLKVKYTEHLYCMDLSGEDFLALYQCIDRMMYLPHPFDIQYNQAIKVIEEKLKVAYISTAERLGFEQGMQQGMQQGVQQGVQKGEMAMLLRQLKCKFKTVPASYREKVEAADVDTLLKWGEKVLEMEVLEDVFADEIA